MTRDDTLRLIEDAIHPGPRTFVESGRVWNQAMRVLIALEEHGLLDGLTKEP